MISSKKSWNQILLFTDGACSGNPGKGGFGAVVIYPEGEIIELSGRHPSTTNNRMEMEAVIKGLQHINIHSGDVWVITDSTYVIKGITQWIYAWKNRGWKTKDGSSVSNKDLWLELDRTLEIRNKFGEVEWKYVRGHQGVPGNERCDEIAVKSSQGHPVNLYKGSLLNYEYAIYDIPEDLSLPKSSSGSQFKEKKKAHSYLSYVNGELKRHKSWPECESEVKGRPHAKYKKSFSSADEEKIVFSWGLTKEALKKVQ